MKRRNLAAANAPPAIGGYSQAVQISDSEKTLFISGQIPTDSGGVAPKRFGDQASFAWRNLEAQLRCAGMTVDNLVKVTTYLASTDYADENRLIRNAVLGENRPALTVIIAGMFDPDWLIEIEAIACKQGLPELAEIGSLETIDIRVDHDSLLYCEAQLTGADADADADADEVT